jgi:uncharacterized protein YkwD
MYGMENHQMSEQLKQGISALVLMLSVLMLTLLILTAFLAIFTPVAAQSQPSLTLQPLVGHHLFLPVLEKTRVAAAIPEEKPACALNDFEQAVAIQMATHPEQGRETLQCNPILAQVARVRAQDMATRGYFSHVNLDGLGPNYLVEQAGYTLPDWYSQEEAANNLESIGAGYDHPDKAWAAWMESNYHREHVLGLNGFYARQTAYGIGYVAAPDSPFKHYWVVITAPVQ